MEAHSRFNQKRSRSRGLRMLLKSPEARTPSVGLPGISAVALMLVLGACTDPMAPFSPSALAPPQLPGAQKNAGEPANLAPLAAAHKANPADAGAALAYAKALRTGGAKADALAVLETTAKSRPADRRLALERGLLALDLGDAAKAEALLRAAHDPKAPDWRLHSALGAALASSGRQQGAQAQFAKALALAPDHPSILNNLAIAYALDGKAGEAEKLLRKAASAKTSPDAGKMQQNLALVLGLGGKYAESRSVAETALPADKATSNVVYLQKLAEARTAAAGNPPAGSDARPKAASAGLPPPTYQLGAWPEGTK
jgi:Flp pilus assembly protein TadD